jgi:ABC-2 type transport system permease protein
VTIAFVIAGVLAFGLMRLAYWRLRTQGVPVLVRREGRRAALGWGLALGLACAAGGLAYMWLTWRFHWLPAPAPEQAIIGDPRWLLALTVLAAPLCEEFIFRGLIFAGMRRSLPLLPALLVSAGLFAAVHPPMSMLPVFGLGIGAALAYERTRMLLAPIVVHAVYNAIVVGAQFHRGGLL